MNIYLWFIEWIADMILFFSTLYSLISHTTQYRERSRMEAKRIINDNIVQIWWVRNRTYEGLRYAAFKMETEREEFLEKLSKEIEEDKIIREKLDILLGMAGKCYDECLRKE